MTVLINITDFTLQRQNVYIVSYMYFVTYLNPDWLKLLQQVCDHPGQVDMSFSVEFLT